MSERYEVQRYTMPFDPDAVPEFKDEGVARSNPDGWWCRWRDADELIHQVLDQANERGRKLQHAENRIVEFEKHGDSKEVSQLKQTVRMLERDRDATLTEMIAMMQSERELSGKIVGLESQLEGMESVIHEVAADLRAWFIQFGATNPETGYRNAEKRAKSEAVAYLDSVVTEIGEGSES